MLHASLNSMGALESHSPLFFKSYTQPKKKKLTHSLSYQIAHEPDSQVWFKIGI